MKSRHGLPQVPVLSRMRIAGAPLLRLAKGSARPEDVSAGLKSNGEEAALPDCSWSWGKVLFRTGLSERNMGTDGTFPFSRPE